VTGWLLDTNILSELRCPKPERKVLTFIAAQPLEHLYVSAVTFAEIRFGIEVVTDTSRRAELNDWRAMQFYCPLFGKGTAGVSGVGYWGDPHKVEAVKRRRVAIHGVAQYPTLDVFVRKRPFVCVSIGIICDMNPHLLAGMEYARIGMIAYSKKGMDLDWLRHGDKEGFSQAPT